MNPCSRSVIPGFLLGILPRLALVLSLAVVTLGASATSDAGLVPYRGKVSGVVVCDLTLQNPTASAMVRSSPFGKGHQEFEELTLTVSKDGPYTVLDTAGVTVTTTSAGHKLRIQFALHGIFTGPASVEYTGVYSVIPGGTGIFNYPNPDIPLGEGIIVGSAEVTPDLLTGTVTFAFQHGFRGTVRVGRNPRDRE